MPKHITLSRRKQSEPVDLDTFKEKRAQREKKKRKTRQETKVVDAGDADADEDQVVVAPVPKRSKQPLAIAKETKKKVVADEADDDDDIKGFAGEEDDDDDDDDGVSDSSSSSLSVGDVRNEFEALQSSIEQGLAKQKKRKTLAASSDGGGATSDSVHPDLLPAVLYVGHIPYGFHERQLEAFFGQFGEISRVKLARSKRTGGSRHFAFVEFRRLHVAKVVVEAMNGYIMFRRRLVCAIVPPEKCHDRMWSVSRKIVKSRGERRALSQLNYGAAVTDAAKSEAAEKKRAERNEARKQKLASLGINLDHLK